MPTARTCLVSFSDSENIRHAVEVTATTLYEAAVLAMAEFRRCGFTANAPGPDEADRDGENFDRGVVAGRREAE